MLHRNPQTYEEYKARFHRVLAKWTALGHNPEPPGCELFEMFLMLDLTPANSILAGLYADGKGRPSRAPADMLRALLFAVATNCSSIPALVKGLRNNMLYAAIAGFDVSDVPGIGTFYDFLRRLWALDRPNLWPDPEKRKKPKPKVKPPKKKGQKADAPEEENVRALIERLSKTDFNLAEEAFGPIFEVFNEIFVKGSIRHGIIDPDGLRISGDGTPIRTAARVRYERKCECLKAGIRDCTCPRRYSQPDANYGWDSHRNCYFFGYHNFFITDAASDLPLFTMLNPASTHDAIGFCETFFRFRAYMDYLHPSEITLDSAHDAMAIYEYLHSQSINAFIDLNPGHSGKGTLGKVTFNDDGKPVCPAGHVMKSNGTDRKLKINKFRCPLMTRDADRNPVCKCENPCSTAKYGRTFSFPTSDNLRHFCSPPRESDEWKKVYNSRTSSERVNKKVKEDYHLERGHHRNSCMWYGHTYLTMMMCHLRAWYLHSDESTRLGPGLLVG